MPALRNKLAALDTAIILRQARFRKTGQMDNACPFEVNKEVSSNDFRPVTLCGAGN